MVSLFSLLFLAGPAADVKPTVRVGIEHGDVQGKDHRVIQAAIDYVANLGGGTVEILPGRYVLGNAVQLRNHVRLVGTPGKSILVLGPGRKTKLAADVAEGATEVTLEDASGFDAGTGIFLQDKSGHGFQVSTATIVARTGAKTIRLSQPTAQNYLLARDAEAKVGFSGIHGAGIHDAQVEGLTIEGNWKRPGSETLGGCRGGGIYLADCQRVLVRNCTVRNFFGDAISFQLKCTHITVEDCLCEGNSNVGLHPGSYSHTCTVRNNVVKNNGYVGLFVCVGVRKMAFANNTIVDNAGCGISIGFDDSDNTFTANQIVGNAETGILFRLDSPKVENGAHRNVFENNVVKDNLGPRPARSNSRPSSAGKAAVIIEGDHHDLVFRNNLFSFANPYAGAVILHDAAAKNLLFEANRLQNVQQTTVVAAPAK